MKKTLLSLGTLSAIVAPVASVIACGDGDVPGHEAPYSITIQADKTTPTQANIFLDFKGFLSESYLKEIKSRIAESIVAANKDTLKYKTMKIYIGSKIVTFFELNAYKLLIDSSPLTDANKNNLDVVFNLIDTPFDNFMTQLKNIEHLNPFFKKEIWENQHHQINKLDQDEVKTNLLRLFGYNYSNPDVIDFKYKIISDRFIDFTITRTNVASSPELHTFAFTDGTTVYHDFVEGESINFKLLIPENFSISRVIGSGANDPGDSNVFYFSKVSDQSVIISTSRFEKQIYKIAQFLLKSNGYNNRLLEFNQRSFALPTTPYFEELKALGNSANKLFGYGDNGQTAGVNYDPGINYYRKNAFKIDFDKKTFNVRYKTKAFNEKQWVFGKDGDHLIVEPTKEWWVEVEGTYELNDAGEEVETITSLTKAIATDGTNSINILESSAKILAKGIMNGVALFKNHQNSAR